MLGKHAWDKWKIYMVDVVTGAPKEYRRTCPDCQRTQIGKAITKIVIDKTFLP
jgi:hypothetical protein